jgi:hypothetical protein
MKNTRLTSILSSSLIAGALTIGSLVSPQFSSAQSPRPLAEVNIPFDFQTPSQSLPAGHYQVDVESNHLILLRGNGSAQGFVVTSDVTNRGTPAHGTMVFARYGDKYYLRQIWTAGDPVGIECPKSRAEKKTMQAMQASLSQDQGPVELALNTVATH